MDWDVFISHAWEDKESFVRPLAEALRARGLRVWYDEFTITVGDSLRRSIDRGLANSRYGIVVLSPNFFAKDWPQKELDGLSTREANSEKVILPIWHQITAPEVRKYSPILADRVAVSTSEGLEYVVAELLRAMRRSPTPTDSQKEAKRKAREEAARVEQERREREERELVAQEKVARQAQEKVAHGEAEQQALRQAVREQTAKQIIDLSLQLDEAESHQDWNRVIELGEHILKLDANNQTTRSKMAAAFYSRGRGVDTWGH